MKSILVPRAPPCSVLQLSNILTSRNGPISLESNTIFNMIMAVLLERVAHPIPGEAHNWPTHIIPTEPTYSCTYLQDLSYLQDGAWSEARQCSASRVSSAWIISPFCAWLSYLWPWAARRFHPSNPTSSYPVFSYSRPCCSRIRRSGASPGSY